MKSSDIRFSVGDTIWWEGFDCLRCGTVKSIKINSEGITYYVRYDEYSDLYPVDQNILIDKKEVPCRIINGKIDEAKDRIKILCGHLKGLRKDYKEAKHTELIEKLAGLK